MVETRKVKIANLLVNTENFRFVSLSNQHEAINHMVKNQGIKLVNLAEDMMENGTNPNDKIQIYKSRQDETKYIVLEGNRRIVSLKLLFNPDILEDDFVGIKNKFKKLHNKYKNSLITEIECNLYDDPKDADHWIGLKHGYGTNGAGTETWGAHSKTRYEEEVIGKSNVLSQVLKLIKESPYISKELKNKIPDIKLTNLSRLISDPEVREFLGLECKNGVIKPEIDKKELAKGLEKVVKDCLDPKFRVKEIYSKDDRRDYIESFPKESIPNKSKKGREVDADSENKSTSGRVKKRSRRRTRLIPSSFKIHVKNPRTNAIYNELQKINIERYPNAVAVLFRVFIELSLDCFLEEKKMISGPSATKEKMRLDEKVNKVERYLTGKKIIDSAISKGFRVATSDSNNLLGIDTWHAYVHNSRFSPCAKDLITTWDNIETFIEKLWEELK